jgi:hypothetical protein
MATCASVTLSSISANMIFIPSHMTLIFKAKAAIRKFLKLENENLCSKEIENIFFLISSKKFKTHTSLKNISQAMYYIFQKSLGTQHSM